MPSYRYDDLKYKSFARIYLNQGKFEYEGQFADGRSQVFLEGTYEEDFGHYQFKIKKAEASEWHDIYGHYDPKIDFKNYHFEAKLLENGQLEVSQDNLKLKLELID